MRCWHCQPCHKQLIRAPLPLTASFHQLETATLEICIARHARCLRCSPPLAPSPSPFRIPPRKSAFKNCEILALTSKCKNRQPPTRTRNFFSLNTELAVVGRAPLRTHVTPKAYLHIVEHVARGDEGCVRGYFYHAHRD